MRALSRHYALAHPAQGWTIRQVRTTQEEPMRARRSVALALTGLLAAATLAACSNGDGKSTTGSGSGTAATVLNVGMPNGPQTENHNPFLGSSSGASLGYRWMIFEPLV